MFRKFLLALLLLSFPYSLFACALCALYTPSATVEITMKGTPSKIETITFEWTFTQNFINTLIERYDENHNKKLDPKELERIKIILENYIAKRHYLTTIEYLSVTRPNQEDVKKLPLHVKTKNLFLEGDTLVFRFTTEVNQAVEIGDELSFTIEDKEEYFKFLVHSVTHTIEKPFSMEFNLFNHIAFTKITDGIVTHNEAPLAPIKEGIEQQKELPTSMSWLQSRLTPMQQNIQEAITNLKGKGTLLAYALFLGTSFLYGLLHAAGPGHG